MDFGGFTANLGLGGGFNIMDPSGSRAYGRQRHERRMAQSFSERMSSTAAQRGVKDLEAAGLNRILAAGGQPASSPQSSGSTVQQAQGNIEISELAGAQIDQVQSTAKKEQALTRQAEATAKGLEADGKIKQMDAEIYKKSPTLRKVKLFMDALGGSGSALTGAAAGAATGRINAAKQHRFKPVKP